MSLGSFKGLLGPYFLKRVPLDSTGTTRRAEPHLNIKPNLRIVNRLSFILFPRHPVICSDNDWNVQSPPKRIVFYQSQEVIGSLEIWMTFPNRPPCFSRGSFINNFREAWLTGWCFLLRETDKANMSWTFGSVNYVCDAIQPDSTNF